MAPGNLKTVVIGQFDPGLNIPFGVDEDLLLFDDGLAVGGTGMVDVARDIPAHGGIHAAVVIEGKEEGMMTLGHVVLISLLRLLVGDDFSDILDDSGSFRDASQGEHPSSLDPGIADGDPVSVRW